MFSPFQFTKNPNMLRKFRCLHCVQRENIFGIYSTLGYIALRSENKVIFLSLKALFLTNFFLIELRNYTESLKFK